MVELDRTLAANPPLLAGVIAHELAHARLVGEERVGADQVNEHRHYERLTELLTGYLGMGVFRANSARPGGSVAGTATGDHERAVRSGQPGVPGPGSARRRPAQDRHRRLNRTP